MRLSRRGLASVLAAAIGMVLGVIGGGLSTAVAFAACGFLVATAVAQDSSAHPGAAKLGTRLSVVGWLPQGVVLWLFTSILTGLVMGAVVPEWVEPDASARWAVAVQVVFWFGLAMSRGGRVALWQGDGTPAIIMAVWLSLGTFTVVVRPFEFWSRFVASGTDFGRHVIMVRQVFLDRGLDYQSQEYPRGLHVVVAQLNSFSTSQNYVATWQALESVLWVLLGLVLVGVLVAANRTLRTIFPDVGNWALLAVGFLTLIVYLQSFWFTVFFRLGYATSIAAGVVVASTLAWAVDRSGRTPKTPLSLCFPITAIAVLAHVWTLLIPAFFLLLVVASGLVLIHNRNRARVIRLWLLFGAVAVVGGLVAAVPIVPLFESFAGKQGIGGAVGIVGASGLINPTMPWVTAFAISCLGVIITAVAGGTYYFSVWFALTLGALFTVGYLAVTAGTHAAELSYYAAKTLWTFSVLPLAAVFPALLTLVWLLWTAASTAPIGLARTVSLALVLALLFVMSVGALGRISGGRSLVAHAARNGFAAIPYQIPIITQLERRFGATTPSPQVIAWGVSPNASESDLAGVNLPFVDRISNEALGWFWRNQREPTLVDSAIYGRHVPAVCDYLEQNPTALRITGPNPEAGAPWLIGGGCPVDTVKPEEWISVPIADAWFVGTPYGQSPYTYPTYEEFQAYLAEQEATRNQQTPSLSQN